MTRPGSHYRNGLAASWVGTPPRGSGNHFDTVLSFLCERFPNVQRDVWVARFNRGDLSDETGLPLALDAPFCPAVKIYYFRETVAERRIPFEHRIVFRDDHLIVVDKPHFLPVMPAGRYVRETLLVRLREQTRLPGLSPIHRIDADTAGLVMFGIHAHERGAYQNLFRDRLVEKTYFSRAVINPAISFPRLHQSRLSRGEQRIQAVEVAGEPNAQTLIELVSSDAGLGHFCLKPRSGQRHQLRAHMAALGMPILNDPIYPNLLPDLAMDDDAGWRARYERPLQLIAKALRFFDPVVGRDREFESEFELEKCV